VSDRPSSNPTPIELVGTLFEGKYEVLGEVARGGMGIVYRGIDQSLGRPVAIKVLLQRYNTDPESVERFRREARAMAALDHPNIVPVYAIGVEYELHYFVMKFLTGWTVSERTKRVRLGLADRFGIQETRDILVQLCEGLEHAHRRGLIHRDIKPSNIMIDPDSNATIMDFGIVKETEDDTLTKTGIVFGTPDYMAPEHAQGRPPSPATDLYSLGIVAYEMLTGEQPFRGSSPFSLVLKHIKEPPPPLIERRPDLNQAFQDVIFCAIAKEPTDRYASAGHMAMALGELDLGGSTQVNSPSKNVLRTSQVSDTKTESDSAAEDQEANVSGRGSLPQRRPSIYPRRPTLTQAESEDTPIVQSAPSVSAATEQSMVTETTRSTRPGHYTHLLTSRRSGSRRRLRILKYSLLTAGIVGVLGSLIAYWVRSL